MLSKYKFLKNNIVKLWDKMKGNKAIARGDLIKIKLSR